MIHDANVDALAAAWPSLEMEQLRVTAVLRRGSQIVNYDPIHLDGLIARLMVERATHGDNVAPSADSYWLPLPLQMLWQSPEGLPLWAASVFAPIGVTATDTVYYHKRGIPATHSKQSIIFQVGRWMERRVPLPTTLASMWRARCVGNLELIESLLTDVAHIGKKRAMGFGEVAEWQVHRTRFEDVLIDDDGTLTRPVPVDARHYASDANARVMGWTPPAWKPDTWRMCYPIGERVSE